MNEISAGIQAHADHQGTVQIKWNSQTNFLAAPGGKKYLPCVACMKLEAVEMNVVSFYCDPCAKAFDLGELSRCEQCHHYVKPIPFDNTRDQVRWVPSYADEDGTGFETVRVGEVGSKCPCCGEILDFSFVD
jgi:predicted RNA-binding Zn-ribbon protein involved in translation (DUF1610 family)